jgi:hypothetical protein
MRGSAFHAAISPCLRPAKRHQAQQSRQDGKKLMTLDMVKVTINPFDSFRWRGRPDLGIRGCFLLSLSIGFRDGGFDSFEDW